MGETNHSADPQMVEEIFDRAIQFAPEVRVAFLAGACGGDGAVRRRVERLLAAHQDERDGFLPEEPATLPGGAGDGAGSGGERVRGESAGATIGQYKLLEKLGEGGFGTVWVAEQRVPVRRRVALKIIKLGMDTKQVVARFEGERQALAMMDHPNIAKVLDAGSTGTGRPYFVMELVRGIPITEYCAQERMPTPARLDLFVRVCQAIQHAHQKGIIHRDIKPSNIMVTLHDGVPVPKVIDFGIAKATQQDLTDKTIYTQYSQFIGTPAYMSPEQAEMSGLDIDTRSDIYSLGVLLYEILTGSTPFDTKELMESGIDEMRKIIREREPVRPSTRIQQTGATAVAGLGDVHPSALSSDLDWIVMKCLEKDRARRYETANGLAMDIKRHLGNEPVVARPPSAWYRLSKAWKRNRLAFTAGGAVAAALAAGVGLSLWQAREARDAQRAAELARADEAEQRRQAQVAQREAETERSRAAAKAEEALLSQQRARRLLYTSDMNLVQQALGQGNLGRARDLLDRNLPVASEEDLRGWEWRYFWREAQGDELFTLSRHAGSVHDVEVSPDGRLVAVGLFGAPLELWDAAGRRKLRDLPVGPASVVEFSPDGALLAAGGLDSVTVFATADWRVLTTIPDTGMVRSLDFAPESSRLLVSNRERQLAVYDARSGDAIGNLRIGAGRGSIHHGEAVYSPDGMKIATGDWAGVVQILDAATLEVIGRFKGSREGITTLAFSPDGRRLAVGSGYGIYSVDIWDVEAGEPVAELEGHHGWVAMVEFSPDGDLLASASADQTVRLWDTEGWLPVATLKGHNLEVWSLAFTPDGASLVTGSKDGEVKVWNATARPSPVASKVVGGVGRGASKLLSAPRRGGFYYVDRSGEVMAVGKEPGAAPSEVHGEWGAAETLAISNSGRYLAVGDSSGQTHVLELASGRTFPAIGGGGHPVIPVGFSADEGRLAVVGGIASGTGRLRAEVHEFATGGKPSTIEIDLGVRPEQFDFSADKVVVRLADYRVLVIDAFTGETLADFAAELRRASSVALSPDGATVAIGSEYGVAELWDVASGRKLVTLNGHLKGVHSVGFSPDGKRLLTGSGDAEAVKIWDMATHQEVATLAGQGSIFESVLLSGDGSTVAAVNWHHELHLWNAPELEEVESFR